MLYDCRVESAVVVCGCGLLIGCTMVCRDRLWLGDGPGMVLSSMGQFLVLKLSVAGHVARLRVFYGSGYLIVGCPSLCFVWVCLFGCFPVVVHCEA